jgi:hypothetical protein
MVYKTRFLKQVVENDYDPQADETKTWELSNEALAAIWITVKGDLVKADVCIDDMMASLTSIDLWMGGFNVVHYATPLKALVMNSKLKGAAPYLITAGSQTIDDVTGVTFPILLGAPYLNESMCLPRSESNRKKLTLGLDIATASLDDLLIDIAEVILLQASPMGCIKQEEVSVEAKGTGDKDVWLQNNWDLLKLLLYSTTAPTGGAYTSTINRAGLEINDFAFGYKSVPWEILHGELMDELEGQAFGVEDHTHADPSSGDTGMPAGLEHWICKYGQMDFFYNYDLKWKAPLKDASTAKLKLNLGVDEAWAFVQANYVPASEL